MKSLPQWKSRTIWEMEWYCTFAQNPKFMGFNKIFTNLLTVLLLLVIISRQNLSGQWITFLQIWHGMCQKWGCYAIICNPNCKLFSFCRPFRNWIPLPYCWNDRLACFPRMIGLSSPSMAFGIVYPNTKKWSSQKSNKISQGNGFMPCTHCTLWEWCTLLLEAGKRLNSL